MSDKYRERVDSLLSPVLAGEREPMDALFGIGRALLVERDALAEKDATITQLERERDRLSARLDHACVDARQAVDDVERECAGAWHDMRKAEARSERLSAALEQANAAIDANPGVAKKILLMAMSVDEGGDGLVGAALAGEPVSTDQSSANDAQISRPAPADERPPCGMCEGESVIYGSQHKDGTRCAPEDVPPDAACGRAHKITRCPDCQGGAK